MAKAGTDNQNWTSRKLLNWTTEYLERKGIDAPRRSAEMLLAHVLNTERIKLFMDLDRPASPLERAAFRELVERAARHEPVQYLVGEAWFFAMDFEVNPAVLIPRPSTETLVEHIVQHCRNTPGFRHPVIADICTGSGCIAIALAKHIPGARLIATDISDEALEVARRNAERHDVADRIQFRQGSLYEPLSERVRIIATNPPYIPDEEWEAVEPNVKEYEPASALRGGGDGLDFIRPLIAGAGDHLLEFGQLVMEIAASQKAAVLELAGRDHHLNHPKVLADFEGLPRVLVADYRQ